jgi:hypothetical protein
MKREVNIIYRPRIKSSEQMFPISFIASLLLHSIQQKNPTILHMAHKSRLSVYLTDIFVFN